MRMRAGTCQMNAALCLCSGEGSNVIVPLHFFFSWFDIFRRGKQPPFGDNEPLQSACDSCTGKDKTQSNGMSHHLGIEYF